MPPESHKRLLFCDLDRTILPNGSQKENKGIRQIFETALKECEYTLAYISGRNLPQVIDAIKQYKIPEPTYIISDVGTNIYLRNGQKSDWDSLNSWQQTLAQAWPETDIDKANSLLTHYKQVEEQENRKQGKYKRSYYVDAHKMNKDFIDHIKHEFDQKNISLRVIDSIDKEKNIGFIDLLPLCASKYDAIKFIQKELNLSLNQILFAGDSGNDLDVITSEIRSIVVNNASQEIKNLALQHSKKESCYIAKGNWLGLNGFYCAGVLEGLAYFHDQASSVIENIIENHAIK